MSLAHKHTLLVHKLTTVMFTDIAGYTALMGSDEAGALVLLRQSRSIQKSAIARFNGKWLKEMGDGVLAEFSTAYDSVRCAIAIQKEAQQELECKIRIGIHLGDVTVENDDIFGDGVNIASRLQSIADPGGIYISESVQRAVSSRASIELEYLGAVYLKNVSDPVRTYYVKEDFLPVPSTGKVKNLCKKKNNKRTVFVKIAAAMAVLFALYWFAVQGPFSNSNDETSIAVLAFTDLSPEHNQEYFSDGMSEELQNLLAKIPDLKVISTTSSFSYKGKNITSDQIGNDLNVTHILEGSVRKSGNQFRVKAQLVKVSDGTNIWSDVYERDMSDVFKIQDEIAEAVIKQLKIVLGADTRVRNQPRPTNDLLAYEYYLQGQYNANLAGYENIETSIELFKQAVTTDPNFAVAYAALAKAYITKNVDRDPNPVWAQKAYVAFQHALSLDPYLAEAYVARGMWYWTPGNHFQHDNAIADIRRAIELKPGLSAAYELLSLVQLHVGLLDRALINGMKGVELEPTNMWSRHFVGQVYFFQGKYDKALRMFETVNVQLKPYFRISLLSQTLFYLGDVEEARIMIEEALIEYENEPQLNSTYAIILASNGNHSEAREKMDVAIENKSNLRHVHHLYHNLAAACALMGESSEAVQWLVMAADDGFPCYSLYKNDPNLASLKGDPDYENFLLEMKEKLEYFEAL